ncbi:carbon storage regulator [Roseinatronobacter sp. NSM]|uniref:carbon storage regulator n=1 Tax=Roseinatronobacter sp. NSM TaxID=3457785 RepID=UPI004034F947
MALCIRLKPGESVRLGDNTVVKVGTRTRGDKTWLEIEAPREVRIERIPLEKTPHIDDCCE